MDLIREHPFGAGGLLARLFRLNNGLQVLLVRDATAPVLAYQTWFRVGSRHERPGRTGMAHLFEHLMFNETENLAHTEFDRLIEAHGGHTNAATWVDWTYYQDDLPAAHLELCVRLEADRMANLVVREQQLETEREVVLNERRFRVEDDVDGFLAEELFRLAFTVHPYHWPTIGWMEDIRAITVEDAREFYRTYYAPNNATIVLVGDFQEEVALSLIERYYGALSPQPIPQETVPPEPVQEAERRAVYDKPVATDKLLLGYKAPSFLDPEHLHLQVLSDILFGSASSRCYRELVVDREICSTLGASVTPLRDPGLWEVAASLQRGHSAEEVLEVLDVQMTRMQADGPTPAEMERARARFLTHFFASMRSAHGKAESLGEYETTTGDFRRLFAVPEQLRAMTAADVQRAAQRFGCSTGRTVVIARPAAGLAQEKGK
ncbi:MAG: pitrilysin family protein [Myxococcales bacterium]|nr:insulinase family protein [Myxococcota bacterium]MDW8282160.1 pitrilysin family protein [Myxococcales bacterium]